MAKGQGVNDEDPRKLYDWLTRVQEQWGWSQRRFAPEALDVTPNGMRGWKDGKKPSRANLRAISQGVGVDVETLVAVMRGEEAPIPASPPPAAKDSGPFSDRLDRLEERTETLAFLLLEIQQELRKVR